MCNYNALEQVMASIRSAGYDPCEQLRGYLETGNPAYITRQNGARTAVLQMERPALFDLYRKFSH